MRSRVLFHACLVLLLASGAVAPGATAGPKEESIAVLESIRAGWSDLGLRVWVNDGDDRPIRLGESIAYHLLADRECYVTVVHIDSHGVATLLSPSEFVSENHLEPGSPRTFPSKGDGFGLEARPPLGREVVFVIATPTPLTLSELGIRDLVDGFKVSEAADAPALMERIASRLASLPPESVAIAKVEQRIAGRDDAIQFTKDDVILYFTERTRSIRRPRLGSQYVRFDFDSADLTPAAQKNLDQIGMAFGDPVLAGRRFAIGGHTDDVGTEAYNYELSRRRAEATKRYLVERYGLDADRFEVRPYGESRPLETEATEEARVLNRRVEFELIP